MKALWADPLSVRRLCAPIHDRMPAILPREKWAAWLGESEVTVDELRWMILRPYPAALMRCYPVDVRVGNVRNNDASLFEPVNIAAYGEGGLDGTPVADRWRPLFHHVEAPQSPGPGSM